jgi:N-acetylglucosaminyldiphosphoundecaprenol N-acetyl-beta-D-mannosaminyltransferase
MSLNTEVQTAAEDADLNAAAAPAGAATAQPLPCYEVIGLRIHAVTYAEAVAECLRLAGLQRATMVAASNTHIAVMAREDAGFAEVMRSFDLVVPDGAPLLWSLNALGAGLEDRVYGPYLMERVVRATPGPWRHFLFGGSSECLVELEKALLQLQPGLVLAGSYSPAFRAWGAEDEEEFVGVLEAAAADFIWVALGGGKQERLIARLAPRLRCGCLLAVGDAFPLLAGVHAYAPGWVQRVGLTWLWRVCQEPRRLAGRYLRNNWRFVRYWLTEWWSREGRARKDA